MFLHNVGRPKFGMIVMTTYMLPAITISMCSTQIVNSFNFHHIKYFNDALMSPTLHCKRVYKSA